MLFSLNGVVLRIVGPLSKKKIADKSGRDENLVGLIFLF